MDANQRVTQVLVVTQAALVSDQTPEQMALFTTAGVPLVPLTVASNVAAAQANTGAMTAAAAVGAAPTKAEFDLLLADATANRTAFNDLLAKLRTANLLAT